MDVEIIAHVARIRGREATLALSIAKDLGEAVVLGHAAHLAETGGEVYVVIDDVGGQRLAQGENVQLLTVEDLLLAAVQLHLLPGNELRATYDAMRPFGSGLPSWEASTLKPAYQEWKRSQHQP